MALLGPPYSFGTIYAKPDDGISAKNDAFLLKMMDFYCK